MKGNINTAITLAAFPKWTVTNLTYSFYTTLPSYYNGVTIPNPTAAGNPLYSAVFDLAGLNSAEQAVVVGGLDGVGTFTPLTFTSAVNSHTSTLGFGAYTGLHVTPGASGYASQGDSGTDFAGDVWLTPTGRLPTPTGLNPSFGYHVAVHEIGHALGLRHPIDPTLSSLPVLTGIEDSESFTIMSTVAPVGATSSTRVVYEFQLYDIAALQRLYGPNTANRALSDGYGWFNFVQDIPAGGGLQNRYFCIWDAGGTDIIDAKADESVPTLAGSAYIDLRPGYFSSLGMNTGVTFLDSRLSDHGIQNVSIAFGAYIESARGTVLSDALVGNNFTNGLDGDAGDDLIFGSGAAIAWANAHATELGLAGDTGLTDTDAGDYRTITQAGIGTESVPDEALSEDELNGGDGNDLIVAGAGNTTLSGGNGDDKLMGGIGADTLEGGAGDDMLWGMDGDDTVDYSSSLAPVRIAILGEGATASISVRDGLGGTDTLHSIETIVGTTGLDVFRFSGVLDTGYALTLDANGGQSQHDMLNLVAMGTGFELEVTETGGILTSKAGEGHAGGGTVTLLNFHTQILGSAFDDTIADTSTGRKTIDGGDVITVGGDARAMLRGGAGDDVLTGGDGDDVLIGGDGVNQLSGGDGTDMLISDGASYAEESDVLEGGGGSDLLVARGERADVVLRGGAGNDLIRIDSGGTMIELGAGDGHDTREEGYGGAVRFTGFNLADATIYWDVTIVSSQYSPGGLRWGYEGIGDLAIVVGDVSIVFRDVGGSFGTVVNHDLFVDPTFFTRFDLPDILFEDGYLMNNDGYLNIPVVQGPIAQYDLADADYAAGVADSIVDDVGTSGDDDLSGGIGDDSLAGGDGADSFHASGGTDAFDGGAGSDTLYLFGARLDYAVSRDAVTGDVTLEDQVGTEGAITVKSVEKIYFATNDEAFEPGELTGYYGTAGNDVIAGTARDNGIYGLAGDDDLSGGDGADRMDGGEDDDALYGEGGDDVLIGGAGDNSLDGGDGIDRADYSAAAGAIVVNLGTGATTDNGLGGTDTLTAIENVTGSAFADTLTGDAGANVLDGGGGDDALAGGDGNDTYFVDAGDVVTEDADAGIDTVVTTLASYALGANVETLVYAGSGNFTGAGNALGNLIRGGEGDDDLSGGDGDDVFEATGGLDLIDGGNGADTIRFAGSLYYRSFSLDGAVATVVAEGTMQLTGVEYYYFETEGQSYTIDELVLLSVSGTAGNDALLEATGSTTGFTASAATTCCGARRATARSTAATATMSLIMPALPTTS